MFEKPKNPYRKRGKNYNISENSRLAGTDFRYATSIAKNVYKIFKTIQPQSCQRSTFNELCKRFNAAVRNDNTHTLGALKLGYGSVEPLKGQRLSKKVSWRTFIINYPTVNVNTAKGYLEVTLQPIHNSEIQPHHPRQRSIAISLHCIKIKLQQNYPIDHLATEELILEHRTDYPQRKISFPLGDGKDMVIILVGVVRTHLQEAMGTDIFVSNDTRLMAAECIDAVLIRDGEHRQFHDVKILDKIQPILEPLPKVKWE